MLLRTHGGPNRHDQHSFNFERQFFAANGYVVLNVNYRGSAGRGSKYSESIFADWGNKEVADLLAGVDHVVAMGIADPDRLGIGGWSYGGILTDYTIATDTRFKAAISGAGSANQIAMSAISPGTTNISSRRLRVRPRADSAPHCPSRYVGRPLKMSLTLMRPPIDAGRGMLCPGRYSFLAAAV